MKIVFILFVETGKVGNTLLTGNVSVYYSSFSINSNSLSMYGIADCLRFFISFQYGALIRNFQCFLFLVSITSLTTDTGSSAFCSAIYRDKENIMIKR